MKWTTRGVFRSYGNNYFQWRIQWRGPGARVPPRILRPNWGLKGGKNCLETAPSFSKGLDDRPHPPHPPLSQGLYPALTFWKRIYSMQLLSLWDVWFHSVTKRSYSKCIQRTDIRPCIRWSFTRRLKGEWAAIACAMIPICYLLTKSLRRKVAKQHFITVYRFLTYSTHS